MWEIAIKRAIGKLELPGDFENVLARQGFEFLDIKASHTFALRSLPLLHRDPFDRMIIAQAQTEGLRIVTRDLKISAYLVSILQA